MDMTMGIDIGSTTVKLVIVEGERVVHEQYERHLSQVRQKTLELMEQARPVIDGRPFTVALSGSAGLGLAKEAGIAFVQEVFATGEAVRFIAPDTDVVIELGGEDAKIIFLTGGLEERMNGSCAGGTGAFIDQMATLLNVSLEELDRLSLESEKLYMIASRCGVFAKSDIQPLLNQGARKQDVAASIFKAVVDQTIVGLAQGRRITGKVLFLGGPLYYFEGLRREFVRSLALTSEQAVFPENGRYAVALGTALYARKTDECTDYQTLVHKLENATRAARVSQVMPPLFENKDDYAAFLNRHSKASVERVDIANYQGDAYLGVDCGSTTTKIVLITSDGRILYDYYSANHGAPVRIVREQLEHMYAMCAGRITIRGSAATGYGEELIKQAFSLDAGLVETMAHYKAARHFNPNVDFILDIGGQDMKCFHIRDGSIDSIMLNEACSSGCGSFISTFANSLGYEVEPFSKLGLFAKYPVDLGSRCTVFMNSSVKQAQKEGAGVEDISAGISMSVVKNAVYKVIRAADADELGRNIVVQGGTFLNDAVLRSFEQEIGREVIRPQIAGLMGAFGAALHAKELTLEQSTLLSAKQLEAFSHHSKSANCRLCTNHCGLTVNTFGDGRRFISGNRCSRPLGVQKQEELPNLYRLKLKSFESLPRGTGARGKIGIPLGLNMLENLPFWNALFTELGFEVVSSAVSTRETYTKGQFTIPSDTVCYPAKLMHGHIADLLEKGVTDIFYPCMTYGFDEGKGDNHFNCPVVAYYPELLSANVAELSSPLVRFIYPHLSFDRPHAFAKKLYDCLRVHYPGLTLREVKRAAALAYDAQSVWRKQMRAEGQRAIAWARERQKKMIVLAGRPYHIDPEINHGIDELISSLGLVVLSEDCVCDLVEPARVRVLNQWTYHSRLYNAAKFVVSQPDMELVQLVSFGCGIDAITTDEVRSILEDGGKLCTQIKIDEITNLGAVKIRLRSLMEAAQERRRCYADR